MKTSSFIKFKNILLVSLLLCGWGISDLFGQCKVREDFQNKIKFKYDGDKDGELTAFYHYKGKNSSSKYITNLKNPKIDFGGLEEGILTIYFLEIKSKERKSRRKKFNNEFKLVISNNCIVLPQGIELGSFNHFEREAKKFNDCETLGDRKIDLVINKNLKESLKVNFGIVHKSIDKPSEWNCFTRLLSFNLEVTGIKEAPVYVTSEDTKDWEFAKKGNLENWIAHLNQFPQSQHKKEATDLIGNEFGQRSFQAEQKDNIIAYEEFIAFCSQYPNFNNIHSPFVLSAKKRIKEISNDVEKKKDAEKERKRIANLPCNIDWQPIKNSKVFEDYKEYLEKYESSECTNKVEIARKKLIELQPLELTSEFAENGYTAIFIKNAFNPRFKDISLDGNLDVNTRRLKDENVLLVKFPKSGNYEVLVEDQLGKKSSISFDNQLLAKMNEDSIKVRFNLQKGSPPYQIDFIHAEKEMVMHSEKGITTEKLKIPKDKLRELGVVGNILVEATDSDSYEAKKLGNIFIQPPEKKINTKYLLYGLAGLVALLTTVLIIFFWRKRKKRTRQFYEYE